MKLTDWEQQEMVELGLSHVAHLIGQPYRWGGDDPINGYDCSGLVMEYLKTIGLAQETEDMNSATMAKTFAKRLKPEDYSAGDIACFASKSEPKTVNHVGLLADVPTGNLPVLVLEAGGGGSKTSVPDAKDWRAKAAWWPKGEVGDWLIQIANSLLGSARASEQNAYIRVRPLESILNRGKVLVCVVNPFEKVVGK